MTQKEQVNKIIDDKLKNADKNLLVAIAKKGTRFWKNLFNGLCKDCKNKVIKNPSMPFEEYCINCQERINKLK